MLGTVVPPICPEETDASKAGRKQLRIKRIRFVLSDCVFISEISNSTYQMAFLLVVTPFLRYS